MFQLYRRRPAKETGQGFPRGSVVLRRTMLPSASVHRSTQFCRFWQAVVLSQGFVEARQYLGHIAQSDSL